METTEPNPYRPPATESSGRRESSTIGLRGARASFTVGTQEIHKVEVYFSLWTGLEVCWVDGKQATRCRSFALWRTRRLSVGKEERHEVEIRTRCLPLWSAAVYVDGEPFIEELFPSIRLLTVLMAAALVGEAVVAVFLLLALIAIWVRLG